MTTWLIDTALYTGLLIGAVLLLRRPVGRVFGPGMAYALWALPLLRFVLPPIVLPASLAPAVTAPVVGETANLSPQAAALVAEALAAEPAWAWYDLLLPLWLGGAVILLGWRVASYRRMRRDVLRGARPVGEAGNVRLVETTAVNSPVAFGVRDKVVALPDRFMAMEDRASRDLAIAHELAHHRGRDILANFAAQPLLAMHWFNPLAWAGWRAMRRDQEAACDARVLAGRGNEERIAYARLIAGFAAGPRLALAAPMACPMIGEKSIIHRLRSLSMTDVSTRRRWLGRILFGGAAIALPLTASISYAATEPAAIEPTSVAPSAAAGTANAASPTEKQVRVVKLVREDGDDAGTVKDSQPTVERHIVRIKHPGDKDGDVQVFEWSNGQPLSEEQQKKLDEMARRFEGKDWEAFARRNEQLAMRSEEFAKRNEQMARRVEEMQKNMPLVSTDCAEAGPEGKREWTDSDGRKRIVLCHRQMLANTAMSLRSARSAIANNRDISAEVRDEVLKELDAEIVRIESKG